MATIGEQLKAAREAKGISESEAGKATRILTKIIVAMEANNFSIIAAPTYAKGFIRLYARYLGLNPNPLLEQYAEKYGIPTPNLDVDIEDIAEDTSVAELSEPFANSPSPKFSEVLRTLPPHDIRVIATAVAALLILIMLITYITNSIRRKIANRPAPQPPAMEELLLNKSLPDLYLIEQGKIESTQ